MNKKLILGTIIVAISVSLIILIQNTSQTSESETFENDVVPDKIEKAAIIDQLHDNIPNKYFQQNATKYLEFAGYDVDLFTTKNITLDFYKTLPLANYKFIVIRTHGLEAGTLESSASLLTGETWEKDKYLNEQLAGQVALGVP